MLKKRSEGRENEYVFPGQGEKYRYIRDVRHHMDLVTESSGVKFILHDLRRTFLTVADAQDLSAYAIKRLANHKMATDVTAGYIVSDVEQSVNCWVAVISEAKPLAAPVAKSIIV